jgi:L-alanine-DL-glutamate epimerase-like enolase superfamily enzyme
MKITAIELGMLRVPLKTPFKTALRTVETVEDVVVLIRTDTGHTGYGEAPPRRDHRRYPRLDHRSDPPLHPPAPDRPGRGQPQPPVRAGADRDGAQHQRQGRGGNRVYDLWAQLHGRRCTRCSAAATR